MSLPDHIMPSPWYLLREQWRRRRPAGYRFGMGEGTKQILLLAATAMVLVIPLRPGGRAVISLPLLSHKPVPVQRTAAHPTPAPQLAAIAPAAPPRHADFGGAKASEDARQLAQWVVSSADNAKRPFVILDKKLARIFVFEPGGKLAGASPVLLGYAAGDDSVVGIGKKPLEQVRPEERTTPAGRFMAAPGRNAVPEDVVWVDYEAAVSMHRVRLTHPEERRLERLASDKVKDRRISYGCINLPPSFFEQVLWPRFRQGGGYVYVMPEVKSLTAVFPALASVPRETPTNPST